MDLELYRAVGPQKRVALGDLADTEFYAASRDERTGIITLQPVNIIDGATKRTKTTDIAGGVYPTPGPVLDSGDDADAPFDPNE